MDNPVFHLGGVIKTRDGHEDFNGPLSLILLLLSRSKIEIRDISISQILNQYLAHLDEMAEMNLDVASEFVAMASHLTYIKTRMLLGEEKPEELEELISSLERLRATDVYVVIKSVIGRLSEMYWKGAGLISKPPEYLPPDNEYRYEHSVGDLAEAMWDMLSRTAQEGRSTARIREVYTQAESYPVSDKIAEITDMARLYGTLNVSRLFQSCETRTETIAAFLAVLELCRSGRLILSENEDDLTVSYNHEAKDESEMVETDGNS